MKGLTIEAMERGPTAWAALASDPEKGKQARWIEVLLRRAPSACGGLAIIGSVLGFARWRFGFPRAIPEHPGLPSMVGNTAVMGLLLGASLLLSAARGTSTVREIVRKVLAGIAAAFAGVSLAEHIFGVDLLLDQLINAPEGGHAGDHPSRASAQSSMALLLHAVALLNVRAPRAYLRSLAGGLAAASGLMAMAVLFGYLFGAAALYGPLSELHNTGMALSTVFVTLALCFGILASRIDDGGVLSILTKVDSGGATARYFVVWSLGFAPVTAVIAIGARLGIYSASFASALVVTCGIAAVSTFTLRVSWRLSRVDAERRRAEELLRLAEAKSSGILAISADAIISADEAQRITMFNEGAEKIFGYAKEEAIGAPIDILIPDRFRAIHREHVARFLRGAATSQKMGARGVELFGLQKSGAEFYADGAISKLAIDGQQILTVTIRDVSERRRAELEIARLYAEAQRAVQIRDDVVGIVAHDLRNPLASVLAQAQLLRTYGTEPGSRGRQAAEAIERAAKRMNRFVQDLLDATRMEAGRLTVEQTRVTVRELVDHSVEVARPLAEAAALELRVEVAEAPLEIWADRERIQQVLENLLGNAIKFTSAGGTITIDVARREGEVLFRVADTGCGIASEDLPHVFERFWQVRRPGRHGAGLGLPIAKGIVESHHGQIWVESTPAVGTTFFFTIPAPPRAEGRPSSQAS